MDESSSKNKYNNNNNNSNKTQLRIKLPGSRGGFLWVGEREKQQEREERSSWWSCEGASSVPFDCPSFCDFYITYLQFIFYNAKAKKSHLEASLVFR
jgi:hypothetical protein